MRILLTVSYDGTDYCGWQSQNGQTTIQQTVEAAVSRLYGQRVGILGASRTDSGVHAYGQRATFTPPDKRIPEEKLFLAMNTLLPRDIRIISSEAVSDEFHVINDVKCKTYVYKIQNAYVYDPVLYRYSYHIREPLDLNAMNEAAAHFLGEHDFKAFCASHSGAATTVRTIYSLDFSKENDVISMEICGNGFLYNMVRIIVGTLADVGLTRLARSDVKRIIESGARENAGRTLPAKGLTLHSIEY